MPWHNGLAIDAGEAVTDDQGIATGGRIQIGLVSESIKIVDQLLASGVGAVLTGVAGVAAIWAGGKQAAREDPRSEPGWEEAEIGKPARSARKGPGIDQGQAPCAGGEHLHG